MEIKVKNYFDIYCQYYSESLEQCQSLTISTNNDNLNSLQTVRVIIAEQLLATMNPLQPCDNQPSHFLCPCKESISVNLFILLTAFSS